MQERKKELLNKFFNLQHNGNQKEINNLKQKINEFLNDNDEDKHLQETLLVLEMFLLQIEASYGEEELAIVAPIVNRLQSKPIWDKIDKSFATLVVTNTETYEQAIEFIEKIFQDKTTSEHDKITMLTNASVRFVRAKYKEETNLEKLTKLFNKYINLSLEMCQKSEKYIHNFIAY